MLCPYCGEYSGADEIVCPACGKLLPKNSAASSGLQSMRQGKRARQAAAEGKPPIMDERQGQERTYVDPAAHAGDGPIPVYASPDVYNASGEPLNGSSMDRPARSVYTESPIREMDMELPLRREKKHRKRLINWMVVLVVSIVLVIGLAVGTYMFISRTETGHRIKARVGMDTTAKALWTVGEEKMNIGDVDGAIRCFLQAAQQEEEDPDAEINVAGLMLLASVYEAVGSLDEAEAVYTHLYTDVVPSATEPYANVIRIMQQQGRGPEAAELMNLAYEKTRSATFYNQRSALLPKPPTANKIGGFYEEVLNIVLTSSQEHEIYFTFDPEAVLPMDGLLYSEPLRLNENTWELRAVCVDGDLVSDEFAVTYRISMPAPPTPYASLAPNSYAKRQKLRLWQCIERTEDPNVTIYYTIDGSMPTMDSPIYTGEPFWLPTGCYCDLNAVAVNEYGKASNTLSIRYKIEASPSPKAAYAVEDMASSLRLGITQLGEFQRSYGESDITDEIELPDLTGVCTRYTYDWGWAVFWNNRGVQQLVQVQFDTSAYKGPRTTAVGDTLDSVIGKYRDYGQVTSPSGNRGLYYMSSTSTGRLYLNKNGLTPSCEDGPIYADYPDDMKVIRYTTGTADSHVWQVDYLCENDQVTAINMRYLP